MPESSISWNKETDVQFIKGVGPARAEVLNEFGIQTIEDLLYYFPRRYLDRSTIIPINRLKVDQEATVVGKVMAKGMKRGRRRQFFEMVVQDSTGILTCRWFRGAKWISKAFKVGEPIAVSGKVTFFNGLSINHPDFDQLGKHEADPVNTGKIIPLYPGSEKLKRVGLDSRRFRKIVHTILPKIQALASEYLPESVREQEHLVDIAYALKNIHEPEDEDALGRSRRRLKFEEFFFIEIMLALRKYHFKQMNKGISYEDLGSLFEQLYRLLPFDLTDAQKRVIREIRLDMKSEQTMHRLLQGDVGSGKTAVAMLIASVAIGNGYQVAFMAPTEILAEQHYRTIQSYFRKIKVPVALLTGSIKGNDRKSILNGLKYGDIPLVVGTHALIQEGVEFDSLGLAIIDEQHRFGVAQRARLWAKSEQPPHVMVMTATPIPRTLAMTLYGDLEVSVIDELPPGRKPVQTIHYYDSKRLMMFGFLKKQIALGRQVYIVYPLIKESEKMDYKDLEDGYESIVREFPPPQYAVSIVHGKMKPEEKDISMRYFSEGQTNIMVATTVIEVGVDVPNASVMVIESAERFGLSQLHQLRGRVGRGADQSYCILMSSYKLSNEARKRIETMVSTNDGFEIAETDLKLRGPGNLEGTQQSGIPFDLKIANLGKDGQLLQYVRNIAIDLLDDDPHLEKPPNQLLKKQLSMLAKDNFNWSVIS